LGELIRKSLLIRKRLRGF